MLGNFFKKLLGGNKQELNSIDKWFVNDKQFNKLYPPDMQLIAKRHWTPLMIAGKAADFLVEKDGVKILDIGSGVGKFCITAAYYKPNATYCGIEQRANLVEYAIEARDKLGLQQINFRHGNFTELNFKEYDHFYFYNSFYEHISGFERIDKSIPFSEETFKQYTQQLIERLHEMPAGTRLVTYHCTDADVPASYALVNTDVNGLLRSWIRK